MGTNQPHTERRKGKEGPSERSKTDVPLIEANTFCTVQYSSFCAQKLLYKAAERSIATPTHATHKKVGNESRGGKSTRRLSI